jgi:hypothetical protein
MLKYCYEKWNKNQNSLEAKLREVDLSAQNYESLLALTIDCIFNDGDYNYQWDTESITEIDNGDYQGTLLYLIPESTYQPSEREYLMTYMGYGSCSGCDLLQAIQPWSKEDTTEETIKNFMSLCKDFVTNMIKPYNTGWRQDDKFEHITIEE